MNPCCRDANGELIKALIDAREAVGFWGAYASKYFQDKHGLSADLALIDEAIAKHKAAP
jgi:hypothetical protein